MTTVKPFPKYGVKLSYFTEFINSHCGGVNGLKNLSTTDVSIRYLKPLTADLNCSLCAMLLSQNHTAVGEAHVFISHAWMFIFLDVVEALQNHFVHNPDIIIWFDLFSNNQHDTESLPFDWWSHTFKSAVHDLQHVVMVFAPWSNPIPLTRAWCLFELYCTVEGNCKFEVAMSKAEMQSFAEGILQNAHGNVAAMLSNIDCERSQASKASDRDLIFTTVQSSVGFDKINSMVFERLRAWVIAMTEQFIEDSKSTSEIKSLSFQKALINLLIDQGRYADALPNAEICLSRRIELLGLEAEETLLTKITLANIFKALKYVSQAEDEIRSCLDSCRRILGVENNTTLLAMNDLANVLADQRRFSEAQVLYEERLNILLHIKGPSDSNTLLTKHNLGTILCEQGRYALALSHLLEVLDTRLSIRTTSKGKEHDPENHVDTLLTRMAVARCYVGLEQYDQALAQLQRCYEKRRVKLGDAHPATLTALFDLANVHSLMGSFETAQEMFVTCHELQKQKYGDDHEDVLRTQRKLFSVYSQGTTNFELFTKLPSRPSDTMLNETADDKNDNEDDEDDEDDENGLERMQSESDCGSHDDGLERMLSVCGSYDGGLDRMDSCCEYDEEPKDEKCITS